MKISFIHGGTHDDASFRYRAWRPAEALRGTINNCDADVLVFAKPHPTDLAALRGSKAEGKTVIVDTCDIHWQHPDVKAMMQEADALTVNTPYLQRLVQQQFGREATVIIDPYEYEELAPHCHGVNLLWYGHPSNGASFNRFSTFMRGYPHQVVTRRKLSNDPDQIIEWSPEALRDAFAIADIVLMPETAPYKSANRTVEAIRQGCFVVAEPHPALDGFPGIWIGNIKEGVAWTMEHQAEARSRSLEAQQHVRATYSLAHTVSAWKTLVMAYASTSAAEASIGTGGLTATPFEAQTSPILSPT